MSEQDAVCRKVGANCDSPAQDLKVGIAEDVRSGLMPINGMRHKAVGDTSGWYIWAGEYSDADEFFKPVHIKHLDAWSSLIVKYLGLPPGWRFQIDDKGHEDVWEDKTLLAP